MSDIAVVHLNYAGGGGEKVADALARVFDCPLYYAYTYDGAETPEDIDARRLDVPRSVGKSTVVRDAWYVWGTTRLPELYDYDLLIQSGNESAWYVPPEGQKVIRYAHSTPRTPFDRYPEKGGSLLTDVYSYAVRSLYGQTVPYPDRYVCNSAVVARRHEKYLGVPSDKLGVVHPPVEFPPDVPTPVSSADEYYFTWSRLEPNKAIDDIINAFKLSDRNLVIAGDGSQRDRLEHLASDDPSIVFEGYVERERLYRLIAGAKATVFNARQEDFGIVPVESMALKTPVIGVREGFTQYQIKDGVNGYLYDRGVPNLSRALFRFEKHDVDWTGEELRQYASQYRTSRFAEEMSRIASEVLDESINPRVSWDVDSLQVVQ